MKNKIFISAMVLILTACVYDLEVDNTSLEQRNEIMAFLENIKEKQLTYASAGSSANQTVEKLDELIQSIDYASTEEKILKGNRKVLLVNIKNLSTIPTAKKLKLILYLNDMDIVRGKIVSFDEVGKVDHNRIIELLLNRHSHTLTGQLSTYTLSQKFLTSASFEEGVIRSSSRVSKHKDLPNGGRLDECIDYYLVTTYYNSSGMVTGQNWRFLVRECNDNPCDDPYEESRVNCGGSGSGTQTPGFPASAVHGTQYSITYETGETIFWLYTCDGVGCSWSVTMKILPEMVVATQQENYPNLQGLEPVHGMTVFGDDGFLYKFDSFDDTWEGIYLTDEADIWEEEVCLKDAFKNNPCLLDIWNKMKQHNVGFEVIERYLTDDDNLTLCIDLKNLSVDGQNPNGHAAPVVTMTNGQPTALSVTLNINSQQLNRSKLSIAKTILHEMYHAQLMEALFQAGQYEDYQSYALNYPGQDNFLTLWNYYQELGVVTIGGEEIQHEYMAQHYVDDIAAGLAALDSYFVSNTFRNSANSGYFEFAIGEPWNWQSFYKYVAWEGLHQTAEFQNEIVGNGLHNDYINYRLSFEDGNAITLDCTNN